jgi:HAL2 family 3'(2'),5'-bisphosphate nucleotidase
MPFARELEVAVAAVRDACRVCRAVQADLVTTQTIEKRDKSPVTVADFASQAVVCHALAAAFPDDRIVGEEAAHALRLEDETAQRLRAAVTEAARGVFGPDATEAEVLDAIDRGGWTPPAEGAPRYWTLDPIDGTKGFLRGEQYAVALALVVGGRVALGVLGCPNLPTGDGNGQGVLMTAMRGAGTRMVALDEPDPEVAAVHVAVVDDPSQARFCESVEAAHSDQDESATVARALGIAATPYRIDSQCKYAAVARGDASIYLRLPTSETYREKIWDHAAGAILVEEAGGRVTDVDGRALDFSQGRTLASNQGIVATCGPIHDRVVEVVRGVRASEAR